MSWPSCKTYKLSRLSASYRVQDSSNMLKESKRFGIMCLRVIMTASHGLDPGLFPQVMTWLRRRNACGCSYFWCFCTCSRSLVLLAIVAAVNYVLLVVCSLCLLFRQFVAAAHAGDGNRGKLWTSHTALWRIQQGCFHASDTYNLMNAVESCMPWGHSKHGVWSDSSSKFGRKKENVHRMSCQITFPTLHVWWFLGFSAPCQHVGPHTPTCTPSVHLSHRSPLFPFPPLPFPWCPRATLVIFCALPWFVLLVFSRINCDHSLRKKDFGGDHVFGFPTCQLAGPSRTLRH